jgi:hypothetical protein
VTLLPEVATRCSPDAHHAGSLDGIVTGLAKGDSAAIRRPRGIRHRHAPTRIWKNCCRSSSHWGMATHQQFDTLAASRPAARRATATLAQLGRITQLCVSCHATYRIALR